MCRGGVASDIHVRPEDETGTELDDDEDGRSEDTQERRQPSKNGGARPLGRSQRTFGTAATPADRDPIEVPFGECLHTTILQRGRFRKVSLGNTS